MAEIEPEPIADASASKPGKVKRHILLRLFGIKVFGWIKLILLCVLVGFFVMAAEYDPMTAEVDAVTAVSNFARSAFQALGWMVANFWKPALAGASIVIPIWVLWRMATLPFRK